MGKNKGYWWDYSPHSKSIKQSRWIKKKSKQGSLTICAIDPGVVHLGIRVESKSKLGTVAYHYALEQFTNDRKSKTREKTTLIEIMSYIKSLEWLFERCDLVIIERQLGMNRDAEPVMFALLSYFITLYKDNDLQTIVVLVSPKLKSLVFYDLSGLKKRELKLETVAVVKKLLKHRQETSSYKLLKKTENTIKGDDLADPVVMIESFLLYSWIGAVLLSKEFINN